MKKKSIGNSIRHTFFAFTIIGGIVFCFLMYLQNNIAEKYNEYMEINLKLSRLSVEFSNSWSYFDTYVKTHDKAYVDKYSNSNRDINKELNYIRPFVNKDEEGSIYLRTLSNMIEYYEDQSNTIISMETLDEGSYNELMMLKTLAIYINKQSEQLTVSYLNYSNMEYSETLNKYKAIEAKVYIAIIAIIAFGFIFVLAISMEIIETINELCRYAGALSDARWEIPDVEDQKYEEINSLAHAFNKMKRSIRIFVDELHKKSELENNYNKEKLKSAEKDKLIKESQLMALQSQVNPHFLFNMMNTISRMAMFENADETMNLTGAASKILRYNLSSRDKLVQLSEELDMIRSYVLIQETRFQDQMTFNFNINDRLIDVKVPPMIIQPIVENAIVHGLQEKSSGGIIDISVEEQNGFCSINIEDNGKGMTEETINKILNNEEIINNSRKSKSLGVRNVKMRLELYFNRSDLLKIRSIVGHGTKISILIPLKDGE